MGGLLLIDLVMETASVDMDTNTDHYTPLMLRMWDNKSGCVGGKKLPCKTFPPLLHFSSYVPATSSTLNF